MLVGEHFEPYHLVFADESYFNHLSLPRNYVWSPQDDCARRHNFFVHGKQYIFSLLIINSMVILVSYSIHLAISLDGIIHLEVIDRAFTRHKCTNFIWGVLDQMQPWPLPNSVLVMDNAHIHKVPDIQGMVEKW